MRYRVTKKFLVALAALKYFIEGELLL